MTTIRYVDTTIRDGHLSLWASGMTTGMMLPVAERLDKAGFDAVELLSDGQFGKSVRELKDDPWERMRLISERMPNTPLRLIAGRINTFEYEPPAMFRLFLKLAKENGIAEARMSDPWNDFAGWKRRVEAAEAAGLKTILNLVYSISPVHTDEYYAERCRLAATLPVYRICLKDPGGLLTPERTRALVPIVLKNAGDIPVEFHTHCTTGMGPLCTLDAIDQGIEIVSTAIPPLSDGTSNPSVFNVVENAGVLGYDSSIDLESLRTVSDHFTTVAKREGLPIGVPVAYDAGQHKHQVPGGMISNLAHQLRLVGMEDRLSETLEETARVRAELGYPIMVTPLSQFVGSQAAINVIVGERYKEVTDQVIEYAHGYYGEEAVTAMDPDVRDKILSRTRASEMMREEVDEPTVEDMRKRYGGPNVSDEEMILRWLFGGDDVETLRQSPPPVAYPSDRRPLISLIEALTKRSDCSRIQVRKPGLSVTLERRINSD